MTQRFCWNCKTRVVWGLFCVDCVRAAVVSALATALAGLLTHACGGMQ